MTESTPTPAELVAALDRWRMPFWRLDAERLAVYPGLDARCDVALAIAAHKQALLAVADQRGQRADAEGWYTHPRHGHRIGFTPEGTPVYREGEVA
jgi:hypothetical protein